MGVCERHRVFGSHTLGGAHQVEQKRIAAATDSVLHRTVRQGRRRVGGSQQKVQPGVVLPPGVPSGPVSFSLGDQLPLLERAPLVEPGEQPGPDVVATDVFDPQIIQISDGTGDPHVESELRRSGIVPLAGPIEGMKGVAAVGVQESGGDFEGFVWRWGLDVCDVVSLGS